MTWKAVHMIPERTEDRATHIEPLWLHRQGLSRRISCSGPASSSKTIHMHGNTATPADTTCTTCDHMQDPPASFCAHKNTHSELMIPNMVPLRKLHSLNTPSACKQAQATNKPVLACPRTLHNDS